MLKDYHIIIVPSDKAQTKSFKVSRFTLRVMIISAILSFPIVFGAVLSALHYQNKVVAIKRENYENRKLIENKTKLVEKIANLEKKLSIMDASVAHLGQAMDIDLESMKIGLGPVSDTEITLRDSPDDDPTLGTAFLDDWMNAEGGLTLNSVKQKLSDLKDESSVLNQKIQEIFSQSKDKIRFVNAVPSIMPVSGWITSEFGMRKHPIFGSQRMHYGLDIASPIGALVKSPAEGKVVFAGPRAGYGNLVVLDHGYGISTLFAHLSAIETKIGALVKKGDLLAKVGSTGSSTGPHLHYEIQVDGIPTDPLAYVVQ